MALQAVTRFRTAVGAALLLVGVAAAVPVQCQVSVSPDVLRLYALRGDSLLWHREDRLSPAGLSAIHLLRAAAQNGLDPAAYQAALLDSLARRPAAGITPEDRNRLDLRLTANLVRFLGDVRGGQARGQPEPQLAAGLAEAIAADSLLGLVAALEPGLVQYRELRRALAEYRLLAEDSTLGPIPATRTVHPGEPYEGVDGLARLLSALGDLPQDEPTPPPPTGYDGPLPAAVVRFQERHGLTPDGILGPASFKALNTPLRWRVRQLELALERLRRLPPLAGRRVVVVNVPAFRLFAFDSAGSVGTPALASRVVVGRALDTRTPALLAEMRSVDFWPVWNVPRSILVNEILPILRRRPEYLRQNGMELVDTRGRVMGDEVSPEVLSRLQRGTLRVRQRPGADNALGPVKFVLPNAADIYLHGTPNPELFRRPRRDLSHGCVRVEEVAGLVTWVLEGQGGWTADSTAVELASGRPRRVALARPLPVAIYYTTAAAFPDGQVFFYDDLYGLDRRLDAELRGRTSTPWALRPPGTAE